MGAVHARDRTLFAWSNGSTTQPSPMPNGSTREEEQLNKCACNPSVVPNEALTDAELSPWLFGVSSQRRRNRSSPTLLGGCFLCGQREALVLFLQAKASSTSGVLHRLPFSLCSPPSGENQLSYIYNSFLAKSFAFLTTDCLDFLMPRQSVFHCERSDNPPSCRVATDATWSLLSRRLEYIPLLVLGKESPEKGQT